MQFSPKNLTIYSFIKFLLIIPYFSCQNLAPRNFPTCSLDLLKTSLPVGRYASDRAWLILQFHLSPGRCLKVMWSFAVPCIMKGLLSVVFLHHRKDPGERASLTVSSYRVYVTVHGEGKLLLKPRRGFGRTQKSLLLT